LHTVKDGREKDKKRMKKAGNRERKKKIEENKSGGSRRNCRGTPLNTRDQV
jgi:hypothetical protein